MPGYYHPVPPGQKPLSDSPAQGPRIKLALMRAYPGLNFGLSSRMNSRFLGGKFLPFGLGKIFELLFGHRLSHLFGRAFKAGFAGFATLGCQCCSRGHLLFF